MTGKQLAADSHAIHADDWTKRPSEGKMLFVRELTGGYIALITS